MWLWGHKTVALLKRKMCAFLRSKTSAWLRYKTCAVLRARTCGPNTLSCSQDDARPRWSKLRPRCSKMIHNIMQDSAFFQTSFWSIRIHSHFKIIQHVSGSQRFDWDSTLLLLLVVFKRSWTPIVLTPAAINCQFVDPNPFTNFKILKLPKSQFPNIVFRKMRLGVFSVFKARWYIQIPK